MQAFRYICLDPSGQRIEGVVDAPSAERARRALKLRGLSVIHVRPDYFNFLTRSKQQRNMTLLLKEWLAFQRFGLNEGQAMESIAKDPKLNEQVKGWASRLHEALRSGISLEQGLMVIGMPMEQALTIERGASLGQLTETLQAVLQREEEIAQIKTTWKVAMFYPAIMFGFILLAVVVSAVWLIPMQQDMLMTLARNRVENLPPLSRQIFEVNALLPLIALVTGGALFTLFALHRFLLVKSPRYALWFATAWSYLPYLGRLQLYSELGGYLRTLALGYSVGLSIQESLNTAMMQVRNRMLLDKCKKIKQLVASGECQLSTAIEQTELSPGLHIVVRRGEFGGRESTAEALKEGASLFSFKIQDELEKLKKTASLVGDVMVYVMGAPVLYALVMPQFEAVSLMILTN